MLSSKHKNLLSPAAIEAAAQAFDASPLRVHEPARVEEGIRRLYGFAAERFPGQVIWVASPLQGALAAAALASTLAQNEPRVRRQTEPLLVTLQRHCRSALLALRALRGQLFDRLLGRHAPRRGGFSDVAVRIWQAVHRPVARATERAGVPWLFDHRMPHTPYLALFETETARMLIEAALTAQLGQRGCRALTPETTAAMRAAVHALVPRWDGELELNTDTSRPRALMPHLWGRPSKFHERAWVLELFASELRACKNPAARERAQALLDANLAGQVWLHRDFVVISEPPIAVRVEEVSDALLGSRRRLHCHDGPAVRFRDDFAVYASHGRPIDPKFVLYEHALEDIYNLPSGTDRRAAIERIGWLKYIEQSAVPPLAEVADPGNQLHTLALYEPPAEYRSAFRLLRMHNGSPEPDGAFRTFVELVPAHFEDPIAAAAWQFGCEPDHYRALRRRT